MFVHLLQALVIAVLFLFPFAYNVNDFSANFNSVNTCSTVDSALVKYYSQTGSLPETLDAETIKKMGLDDKSVEGLTYKKLEDRKFVLSYEDSKSDVKESIHSNTLLPLSTVVNFGEEKPEYLFFEIDKVPHQVLEAKIDFPKGGFIVIREGDKVEVPKNSKYEVHHKADRGYKEGVVSHTKGLVQSDIFVTATAAEMIKYKLSVQDSNTQNVLIDVNDKASNKKFILKQGESALVGPGTIFNLKSITPISGYTSGSVFPSSGQVYKDTNIEVKNGEFKMYTVSVADTAHQTVTVTIKGSDGKTYTIINGQSVKVPYGSTFTASVKADKGYIAGTLNMSSGTVTGDVVVSAGEAKQDVPAYLYESSFEFVSVLDYIPASNGGEDEVYGWNYYRNKITYEKKLSFGYAQALYSVWGTCDYSSDRPDLVCVIYIPDSNIRNNIKGKKVSLWFDGLVDKKTNLPIVYTRNVDISRETLLIDFSEIHEKYYPESCSYANLWAIQTFLGSQAYKNPIVCHVRIF